MRSDFDAEKFLVERGWLKEVAGDDFELGMKIVRSLMCNEKGLILSGTYGCGKTSFVKAVFKKIPCYTMPDGEWILGNSQDALDLSSEAIILDDIGSEHEVFVNCIKTEPFTDFIMRRYASFERTLKAGFKPPRLIITTNYDISQFEQRYGGRVVSRIKEMCLSSHFNGKDKRKWETIR